MQPVRSFRASFFKGLLVNFSANLKFETLNLMEENRTKIFGHPAGLFVLFFTEMWERFSYYGMRAILLLYVVTSATDATNPGLGWDNKSGLALYGWYTMLVYVMSIPGGWFADRIAGAKKAVLIGGLLLCAGHGILAITAEWAFFVGLGLIILGVGALKPNISTMVGGLYKEGDPKRDMGFQIFYIGINVGAFLASIIVGWVGQKIGWHYGFGLAGIGMLLGQATYMLFQKSLKGVGDYVPPVKLEGSSKNKPLTKVEKDRMIVLLLSFLIIIVFWGAFEQAGGLMNLYTQSKVDRMGVPASIFQALNPGYIIIFGVVVGSFWNWWRKKGKESSSLMKMAVGTMIMGLGFLAMVGASIQASAEPYGKAALYWIFLAYFLHTIGELSASPVALSFITKLAPVRYASLMMGIYFAATGFGNKLAGTIGEASQSEPIKVEVTASTDQLLGYPNLVEQKDDDKNVIPFEKLFADGSMVEMRTLLYPENGGFSMTALEGGMDAKKYFSFSSEVQERMNEELGEDGISKSSPWHTTVQLEKKEDTGKYGGTIVIEEVQSALEKKTFLFIFIFTAAFGILLLVFLKKLKQLTHGAEDEVSEEAAGAH